MPESFIEKVNVIYANIASITTVASMLLNNIFAQVINNETNINTVATNISDVKAAVTSAQSASTSASESALSAQSASTSANESALSAQSASTSANESALSAQSASASALIVNAYANLEWASFSLVDGSLSMTTFDSATSTPSIVDGEFIITY